MLMLYKQEQAIEVINRKCVLPTKKNKGETNLSSFHPCQLLKK